MLLIHGSRHHAEELKSEVAEVLKQVGLRLSQEKTTIAHIDEGFDFLGATRNRMARASTLIGGLRPMTAA